MKKMCESKGSPLDTNTMLPSHNMQPHGMWIGFIFENTTQSNIDTPHHAEHATVMQQIPRTLSPCISLKT